MIGQVVTSDKDGKPLDGNGNKLAVSAYNPPEDIKKLFARCQTDYQVAYTLQHRSFDEFDGYSLVQRARYDQQTFGAYVGATVEAAHKQWRWKGRTNKARNNIIGILAHMISGMLYPMVHAYNEQNEEDKLTAKVMRILIENHLRKADYEIKFLYICLSALVNPAVHIEVEYIQALQKIKIKNADGSYRIEQATDELLSGLNLNVLPIDQILIADFFTGDIQRQPYVIKVRRISWDEARSIYAGKYFLDGKDQFDYVEAGKTRVVMTGQEHQTLYDIEWTEADRNFVQELTFYYKPEDLEVTFVGGVFLGDYKDVYNSNPFKHRRMTVTDNKYMLAPVYPFAKTGFEPIDPTGRFYYYKSASFKQFWDDAAQNRMHQLAYDGTYLDVIKPVFLSGVDSFDSTVMVPGASIGMPIGASATPYNLGPNLQAALNMMRVENEAMSESTQDKIMSGITEQGVTAYAVSKAEQNAKVILGVYGTMIANLITKLGELVTDCIIQHTTVGEIDATIPEGLKMKYREVRMRSKEQGKDVTNRIQFTDELDEITPDKADELEWKLFEDNGGLDGDTHVYKVNPYKFARCQFTLYTDPQQIISNAMGTDQLRKDRAFNLLTDPRVAPFVNQQAVVDKYVIDEFSDGDPDQFKKDPNDMLQQIMGQVATGPQPQMPELPTNALIA